MMRKRFAKAALASVLAVSMAATATNWVAPNAFVEVAHAENTDVVTMNIQFKDGDEVIAGGDYTIPAGVQNYTVLQEYVPEGYEMTTTGDFMAEEGGKLVVNIEKISTLCWKLEMYHSDTKRTSRWSGIFPAGFRRAGFTAFSG